MNKKYKELFFNKWFVLLLLFTLLLRGLWFFAPLENDEGIYLYISERWLEGNDPYNYHSPHFPLVFLNYMPISVLQENSFILFRLYGLILFIVSLFFFMLASFEFNSNRDSAYVAGFIYIILMHIPLLQGFYYKPSFFFIFYFNISFYLLMKSLKKEKISYLSSFFLGVALLSNSPQMIYLGIINLIIIYSWTKSVKKVLSYCLIPLTLFIISPIFFFLIYQRNLFSFVIRTISDVNIYSTFANYHNRSFPWLYLESLILPLLILFISFSFRKKLPKRHRVVLYFVSFSIVLHIFIPTYGHHLLSLVPLFSFLGGETIQKKFNRKTVPLVIFLFSLILFVTSIKYYPSMNIKDGVNFQDINTYYEQQKLVDFLKENLRENESFYVFGNLKSLYWLTDRESFSYHNFIYCNMFDPRNINIHEKTNLSFDYKYIIIPQGNEECYVHFQGRKINLFDENKYKLEIFNLT